MIKDEFEIVIQGNSETGSTPSIPSVEGHTPMGAFEYGSIDFSLSIS